MKSDRKESERLPPGQVLTQKWPVLTYGQTPRMDTQSWTLRCFGLVGKEVSWTWKEFLELPRVEVTSDIHCVTRWSRFDNRWEGIAVSEILRRVSLEPEASAVMAHGEGGYTTNIPLEDLRADDALLASSTTEKTCRASTAAPAASSCRSSTSGRAPSGSARSSSWTSMRPDSGRSTAITCTPDPWKEERYSDGETDAMQRMRSEAARRLRGC